MSRKRGRPGLRSTRHMASVVILGKAGESVGQQPLPETVYHRWRFASAREGNDEMA